MTHQNTWNTRHSSDTAARLAWPKSISWSHREPQVVLQSASPVPVSGGLDDMKNVDHAVPGLKKYGMGKINRAHWTWLPKKAVRFGGVDFDVSSPRSIVTQKEVNPRKSRSELALSMETPLHSIWFPPRNFRAVPSRAQEVQESNKELSMKKNIFLPILAITSGFLFGNALAAEPMSASPDAAANANRSKAVIYVEDTEITAKIKAKFVNDPQVRATAISVATLNGVVDLSGSARSESERARAGKIARDEKGTRSVTNRITVEPS